MDISFTTLKHIDQVLQLDAHVDDSVLRNKISAKQIIHAEANGRMLGVLRFGFFWDQIPFMNLLMVAFEHRNRGIGSSLVLFWESYLADLGCTNAMTSTQTDESAKHFYRKLGYEDIGGFTLPGEPLEIVLYKSLPKSTVKDPAQR